MAQEFTKVKLSGSADGKNIKIAATSTPGTQVHQAHASALDEIWLWGQNSQAAAVKLTIEWGEVTAPDGNIEASIPGESGPLCVIPGWLLTNSLNVKAFAGTTNVVLVNGYVNRITG